MWFEASLGKQFTSPYPQKTFHHKNSVVQGVGPEFKPQYCPPPPKKGDITTNTNKKEAHQGIF
jgi:hypothetical protein